MGIKNNNTNLCADSQKAESQSGKKYKQLNMKNKICQWSSHGQQKPRIFFKNKVYSLMC